MRKKEGVRYVTFDRSEGAIFIRNIPERFQHRVDGLVFRLSLGYALRNMTEETLQAMNREVYQWLIQMADDVD